MADRAFHNKSQINETALRVLASVVCDLFPQAKLAEAEASRHGFFHTFVFLQPFGNQELKLVEQRMLEMAKEKISIRTHEMMRSNAVDFFLHHHQEELADIVSGEGLVELCQIGDLHQLSDGVGESTGCVGAVALTHFEKSGDRLYIRGAAFEDKKALKQFSRQEQEAKKRNHCQLGVAAHLWAEIDRRWGVLPKGAFVFEKLNRHIINRLGFESVVTTGLRHEENYEGVIHAHLQLFQSQRDLIKYLPYRWVELAAVEVDEGWDRRGIFQAKRQLEPISSVFASSDQVHHELISSLQFLLRVIKLLGLEHRVALLRRGETSFLTRTQWESVERQLVDAAKECDIKQLDKEGSGYANYPTLQLTLVDCIAREWPGMRLQLRSQKGDEEKETLYQISFSVGTIERLVALVVEHTMGRLPLWLAPEPVRVIPVGEKHQRFGSEVVEKLESVGFRATLDLTNEKLAGRIRLAQIEAIPYTIVIGDREQETQQITVRALGSEKLQTEPIDEFIAQLKRESDTEKESSLRLKHEN